MLFDSRQVYVGVMDRVQQLRYRARARRPEPKYKQILRRENANLGLLSFNYTGNMQIWVFLQDKALDRAYDYTSRSLTYEYYSFNNIGSPRLN